MISDEDVLNIAERLENANNIDIKKTIEKAADRKSTRLNSSHPTTSRMPSSA